MREAIAKEQAVGELGQAVMERLMLEAAFVRAPLADVPHRDHVAIDIRVAAQIGDGALDVETIPRQVADALGQVDRRACDRNISEQERDVILAEDLAERSGDEARRLAAQHPDGGRADVLDHRVAADDDDHVRRILDDGLEPCRGPEFGVQPEQAAVFSEGHHLAADDKQGEHRRDDGQFSCSIREARIGMDEQSQVARHEEHVRDQADADPIGSAWRLDSGDG